MNAGDDLLTAAPAVQTPPPADTAEFALEPTTPLEVVRPPARPTRDDVLGWVGAGGGPWFPSAHARRTGTPREALDGPLGELRAAGLVAVADWAKGAGQGYVLTPAGVATLAGDDEAIPSGGPVGPDPTPPLPEPVGIDPRPPVVTPALLLANVLWFFTGLVLAYRAGVSVWDYLAGRNPAVLDRLGGVTGWNLLAGEWWRLGTSAFVHIGLLHLVLNVAAIGMMGPLAELLWGRRRLAAIYALSALAGGCLAMAVHPTTPAGAPVLLAGASGGIWGVLTSLAAWLVLFRGELAPDVAADWTRRLGRLILLNVGINLLAMTDVLSGLSWEAHLGGGVAGFVAAGLLNALRFGDRPRRVAAAVLLVLAPAVCLGGLAWAVRDGDAWEPLRRQAALIRERAEQDRARAAAAREQAEARAAVEAHNRDVAPLVDRLRPAAADPAEDRAVHLLTAGLGRRPAAAEAREAVAGLRATADQAAAALGSPSGVAPLDRLREKLRAYAEARAKSLGLVLGLLDAPAPPAPAAVKAWKDAQREADRLWPEAGRP